MSATPKDSFLIFNSQWLVAKLKETEHADGTEKLKPSMMYVGVEES